MSFDLFSGFSTLSLKKPSQPIKICAPDATKIFLHSGEDAEQYQSFIKAVSDLAQAFKFLSGDDQESCQSSSLGKSFSNLDFSPDASDWDLLTGADNDGSSVLDEINSYFDWDAIKSIGSGMSYYQIAESGVINTYSDEQAFNLMCSMTESRERVFGVLYDIFGDAGNLTNDSAVIDNISTWLSQYTDVDPHNLGVLRMFFGMQTDFINSLDAYMNCETYWGSDNYFSATLKSKAESYISTLTGDQKTAAESLESKWFTSTSRWDKVGDEYTSDLATTDGSWVKFFQDKMYEFGTKEVVRVVACNIMTIYENQKYTREKAEYEDKKDSLLLDEINLNKIQAKNAAANKKNQVKLLARRQRVAGAGRSKSRSGAAKTRSIAKTAGRPAARLAARAPVRTSVGVAAKSAPVSRAPGISVATKATTHSVQAKKSTKDEKKVI